MLRISKLSDYGVLIVVHLAKVGCKQTAQMIATATRLALPTVSKIVKRLVLRQVLRSERGVNGGYSLSRCINDISLADLVYALEDRTGVTACLERGAECVISSCCQLGSHWFLIDKLVEQTLASISVAMLTQPHQQLKQHIERLCYNIGEL